jgi:CHAT domain-containing protein/tetratricopeptide (TPR) repeat protein
MQFLADCHDGQPATAILWWGSPANSGEGSYLPYEFCIASYECIVDRARFTEDKTARHEVSVTAGMLGQLLYRRQRGDATENLERAIGLLRYAAEQAAADDDILGRASFQQSWANALIRTEAAERVEEALAVTAAALEGWAKDDEPELWGLIMNARGNAFVKLTEAGRPGLMQEAIDCYSAALTAFSKERSPRRWGIAMYGLAGSHLQRAEHGHPAEYDLAIRCLESAGEVRTREQDPFRWALSQHQLGQCYLRRASPHRSSDLARAAEYFTSALDVFIPELHLMNWCAAKIALGRALLELFNLRRTFDYLEQAEQALTDALVTPADAQRIEAHELLADISLHASGRNIGSYDEVLSHRYRALDMCARDDNPAQWAERAAFVGIALVLRPYADSAEDIERGIQYLRDARDALPGNGDPRLRARILSFLGAAYSNRAFGERKSNLSQAEQYCESALELVTMERDGETWATVQLNLGECLAKTDRSIFTEEQEVHRLDRALACFNAALQVYTRETSPAMWADLKKVTGQAYLNIGRGRRNADAIPHLRDASMMYRKLGAITDMGEVHVMLSEAFLGHDDRRSAVSAMFVRRLVPAETAPFLYGQASEGLGNARSAQGRWEDAGLAYRDAVRTRRRLLEAAVMPRQRQQIRDGFRPNLAEKTALAFARAADHAADQDRQQYLLRAAVEILDEGRAADLMVALGRQEIGLREIKSRHPELHERYETSIAEVNASQRADRLHTKMGFRNPDTEFVAERWLADRAAATTAWAEFDAVRTQIRRRTGIDVTSDPMTVDDAASLLGPGKAVACMIMDDERCLTLHVRGDGVVEALWSVFPAEEFFWLSHWLLNQASFAVMARLTPGMDPVGKLRVAMDATLPAAGRDLIRTLAGRLVATGAKSIYMIPCGLLSILPLHACTYIGSGGEETALADEFDVTYLPALSFLHGNGRKNGSRSANLIAVSNPLPHPEPLLFATAQRERISEVAASAGVPVVVLDGGAATRTKVLQTVSGAKYVDFACHGAIDHMEPLKSGLELAGQQKLTLGDLLDSRVLHGVELATLAFCQSSLTTGNPFTDEPVSLAAGFLEAGARVVLGTTWLIDDMATALLVSRFYQYYLTGDPALPSGALPPSTALRRAQAWLRELTLADVADLVAGASGHEQGPGEPLHHSIRPFNHPIYWASFIVLGS